MKRLFSLYLVRFFIGTCCLLAAFPRPVFARFEHNRVRITISAVGDCTLGQDERYSYHGSFAEYYEAYGPAYFFENVAHLFARDDLTIANLEGTLTDSTEAAEKKYVFKGAGAYAELLRLANIEAVNLHNNHTFDYGEEGYRDTQRYLEAQGIGYFGFGQAYVTEKNGIKIGMLGYSSFHNSALSVIERDINALRTDGVALVVVSFHGGEEYVHYPNDTQTTLARRAVDAGADLVLGHHAHVMQGIELYKGVSIVYGLANFCYGGNKNPPDKDTFIYRQTFELTNGVLTDNSRISLIPARISAVTERNNFKPTPLYGEEGARVLRRLFAYSAPFENDYPPPLLRIYQRVHATN